MPKIGKAARGKHRWIGLVFDDNFSEINSVSEAIQNLIHQEKVKLFDYINEENRKSCIIKVKLEEYSTVKEMLRNNKNRIFSITSSGKIRLVRLRLDEYFTAAD